MCGHFTATFILEPAVFWDGSAVQGSREFPLYSDGEIAVFD